MFHPSAFLDRFWLHVELRFGALWVFFGDCCGHIEPCPFHYFWSDQRENIKQWLMETNFDDAEKLMSQAWFDERLSFSNGMG